MKADFRKVTTTALDGEEQTWDISKELGNTIYQKTADLGELELARDIYRNGEVDLTPEQVEVVRRYVREGFKAFVQEGVERLFQNK